MPRFRPRISPGSADVLPGADTVGEAAVPQEEGSLLPALRKESGVADLCGPGVHRSFSLSPS